ncbi:phosphatase PAP2 family protein [Calditrichota bacterium]
MLLLLLINSCGTLRNGHIWGDDVNYLPGWEKIRDAAYDAATAPEVWIPLSGALVVHVTNTDHDISSWAIKRTPIFGSQKNAAAFSDHLLYFSQVAYISSALMAPGGDDFGDWIYAKLKGFSVGTLTYFSNKALTDYIKIETGRLRPDESNHKSFPSGHTSKSAVYYMLTTRNIETIPYFAENKTPIHIGFTVLTTATAWSRIEANRHYPTDVLAGAALGNFIGAFINDAFIGIEHSHNLDFHLSSYENSYMLNFIIKL